ncbi:DinB family protein [Chryseolinea sp. H1M3-3]|uniref:DinB family protein n=1 Tax=Chryseolinea sp. H1M3-3 TaxID=3034144 RepID=UPI0023EA7CB0|nr:DinB family protein [Chryseolinea sp. H1M3-3]
MDIIKLVAYNNWANRRIGKQIESLPPELFQKQIGGSFGSIKATVVHLLESDWLWVQRFKQTPVAQVPGWQLLEAADIYRHWKQIQEDMENAAQSHATHLDKRIEFVTRKGVHYALPFEDLITHITHHGAYHRGQLTDMLRVVGAQPVSTDYFIFCTQ